MGRLALVGCALGFVLWLWPSVALAAPGELDAGYGTGGVFTSPFQTPQSPGQVAYATVDSQQRTVIAATHVDSQGRSHLDVMRLTPQGAVDTSFGPGSPTPGVVEVDFSASLNGLSLDVLARGVAIAGGDKVVALGWVNDPPGNLFPALVRLGSDGSYDNTFGSNGRAVDLRTPTNTRFPDSLTVDASGRILVGGNCGTGCGGFVARYTNAGTPDTGFSAGSSEPGVQVIGQASDVSSLGALADGSVLAAGGSSPTDDAVIVRLGPAGLPDPSFTSGAAPGVVTSGMGRSNPQNSVAIAEGVAAGPGGTVYATGQVADGGGLSARLLRLTQTGSPDPAFGTGSPATGVVSIPGAGGRGVAVAVDGSSCPVVAGFDTAPNNGAQILAARLNAAGRLDQAFNPSGATPGTAAFPVGDSAFGQTIALQNDGKIVIGGYSQQGTNPLVRTAVALRLQGGGCVSPPPPPAPTATTGRPGNVSSGAATLNGTVNPNGSQVSDCHFEYGTTTNYGSSVPCSQSSGSGTSPVAVSAPISGLSPGTTYDYRLVAAGPGGTSDGDNQTLTTALSPTTLSTTQVWGNSTRGASITIPGSATGEHDEAQLSGANAGSSSGSFTFTLYRSAASGPQCTGTPVFTSTVSLLPIENGGASSDPVPSTLTPGTYYWTVSYSGDDANQPSSSSCGGEVLTVQPLQPTTVSTTQAWGNSTRGASITIPGSATGEHDEAQLAGANAGSSSGRFTFNLYRRAASGPQCAGPPVFTSTVSFASDQLGGASSDPVPTTLDPGTYYWMVSYSGDGANQPSSSHCGAEVLRVQAPQPTTLSTTQVWDATRGASIGVLGFVTGVHDEAQLSGANASSSSGRFTFNLYRAAPTLFQCRGTPVFTSTVSFAPDQQGGASSDPVPTTLDPGTYYWTVAYSGDGANQASYSLCGAETLTVLPLQIFPRGGFLFPRTAALRIKCTVLPCRLRVTVNFPVSLRAGEARQHATGKPRVITLARGAITVKTHRLHTVRLRLTAAGRRFVAFHTGRVTVTVAVAMTIRGHTHRTKQRLTLTIAKARTR